MDAHPDGGTDGELPGETPTLTGIHHVRLPVRDAWTSGDWYQRVLGFSPILDLEEAGGLVGVVLRHRCGTVVGLHQDPARASALRGFCVLGLAVPDREDLAAWSVRLAELGTAHGAVTEGHIGWYIEIPDPDGLLIQLYSGRGPNAEEA